ncbi:shikimate dehydrogenase [Tigheibacillus jepli]|uniref:shikimate dehydrogenase n=1 Tax=Tigheibacillus jepli TaxID=3035914 RepID=UPI00387E109C
MKRYGVIGYPIGHSLSPWIHGQFLNMAHMNGEYHKIEIAPENFATEISRLLAGDMNGFNVTVPHKQRIIPFLDKLDDNATAIGAVNTVAYQDGKWIGYNTDGIGFVRSLEKSFPDFIGDPNKKVLILGAGGAARGIYAALLSSGIKQLDVANRTKERAVAIASIPIRHEKISKNVLSLDEAETNAGSYDLIIQTTSVGMVPNEQEQLLSLHNLAPKTIVADIVYQPVKTKFYGRPKKRGTDLAGTPYAFVPSAICV